MSIQSISSANSLWQTMKSDFQTLSQNLTAAQNARQSGTQDQVQISQDALQKAMTAFQNDITSLQNEANGGTTNAGSAGTSTVSNAAASPLQTLNQDLTTLQNAIQSGNQSQIQSAETALQNDLPGVQAGHHHHHHHHVAQDAAASSATNSDSMVSGSRANPYAVAGTQTPTTINVVNLQV